MTDATSFMTASTGLSTTHYSALKKFVYSSVTKDQEM